MHIVIINYLEIMVLVYNVEIIKLMVVSARHKHQVAIELLNKQIYIPVDFLCYLYLMVNLLFYYL